MTQVLITNKQSLTVTAGQVETMSEAVAEQTKRTNTNADGAQKNAAIQRKCACGQHTIAGGECDACRQKRLKLQRKDKTPIGPTRLTADATARTRPPRFGAEFTHVHLRTPPAILQRLPRGVEATIPEETAVPTPTPSTAEATPAAETAEPGAAPAVPTSEPAASGETAVPGLLVADEAADLGAGQMRKSEFLAELRTAVCAAADAELAAAGRDTAGCPYLDYWFDYYEQREAAHVERALRRYAPAAHQASSARDYIPLVAERVRQGVARWARTGELSGVPEGIPLTVPGLGGLGGLLAGAGGLFFQPRPGGARPADDPQAIQAQLGHGRPLDGGVRARMESAFGTGFGHVRLHNDNNAADLSSRQNARAFTVGEHVAFGAGEYQPGTLLGDALIAHELAHVVQQGAKTDAPAPMEVGSTGYDALERDADALAAGVVASLWGRAGASLADIRHQAVPRLRSGVQLQRCSASRPQVQQPSFQSPKGACLTVNSMEAKKTGNIVMTTAWPPPDRCEMVFGEPNASGMAVETDIDVPWGCRGKLEYVQLVDSCRQLRIDQKDFRRKSTGYILDKQDPWRSVSINSPGNSTFFAKDSPGQPVMDRLSFVSADDKFKTWLLWTPAGGSRTPLAKVEWYWKAKATRIGTSGGCTADWKISEPDAKGGIGAPTTEMPTWTEDTKKLNESAEPGTC